MSGLGVHGLMAVVWKIGSYDLILSYHILLYDLCDIYMLH